MAVDVTALKTAIEQSINSEMTSYTEAIFEAQGVTATVNYADFAAALSPAIILAVQTILDDADLIGVTAGSDTVVGGLE